MTVLLRNQTNLPIILYHIRQLLIDNLVYTPSSVFLGVVPENLLPPNISYCQIIPGLQTVINPETGNLANVIDGEINLQLYHRFYVDPANRDTIQLTDQVNGILQKVNLINLVLNIQELEDAGNWILCNPMHLLQQENITDGDKWLGVQLTYLVRYGYDPTAYSSQVSGIHEYDYEYDTEYNSTNITP